MWHEARKQEKMIRGLMVDYRRRAERRKDFYEKMKSEPLQILQLHGRRCKIHLDPAVAAAGDSPAIMMPWQGDPNNLIDRFDVRAHLDVIAETRAPDIPPHQLPTEERQFNYERYRILAQNTFLGISEDKFLAQLAIEEQFGVTLEEKEAQKEKLNDKRSGGATIGYNYNNPDSNPVPSSLNAGMDSKVQEESDEDSDLEIIDVDLSIDVSKVEPAQAHALNAVGPQYGLAGADLFSFLTGDADDAEQEKQRLRDEKEKAMFSGRKSRRERRAHRDKKLATRVLSPPSYAAPNPQLPRQESRSPSRERSSSPCGTSSPVQFITSFGGEDEEPALNDDSKKKTLYADKVKQNLSSKSAPTYSNVVRGKLAKSPPARGSRSPVYTVPKRRSITRSRSRSTHYRSRSKSPYRLRSRSPYKMRSRSPNRHRSNSPYRGRSRSPYGHRLKSPYRRRVKSPFRSRSKSPFRLRSKSPYQSQSKSRYRSRSKSYRSRSKSPYRRSKSPFRSRSKSPRSRQLKTNYRGRSKSPYRPRSKSPYRARSISKSPYKVNSKSPYKLSKSPYRSRSRSVYRSRSKSPYHSSSRSLSPERLKSPIKMAYKSRDRSYSKSPLRTRYRSRSRSHSRSKSLSPRYRRTASRSPLGWRQRSKSPNRMDARRDSRSVSVDRVAAPGPPAPSGAETAPVAPRYYGRRKTEQQSSSEVSLDSDSSDDNNQVAVGVKGNLSQNQLRLPGSSSKVRRRG